MSNEHQKEKLMKNAKHRALEALAKAEMERRGLSKRPREDWQEALARIETAEEESVLREWAEECRMAGIADDAKAYGRKLPR